MKEDAETRTSFKDGVSKIAARERLVLENLHPSGYVSDLVTGFTD
jgi:hypothetical protein